MSAENHLKVAVVGGGFFSQFHHDAWDRLPVDVVGVCDLDQTRAETMANRYKKALAFTDFEKMLDETKPDLVDIITPPPTHFEFVRAATRRNIHAICQKPFCNSLDEADRLKKHVNETGCLCVVHENFRFQPWYQELKSLIHSGAIGDVYQVSFQLRPGDGQGPGAYLERQPYFQEMPRFLVHETAIHWIDVFRYLIGDVKSVTARLRKLNPAIAGEDTGIILFDFKNGICGLFDGNRLADHAAENRRLTMGEMQLEGSAGVLRLNGDGEIRIRASGSNDWRAHHYEWSNAGFGGDCVYRLQQHVLKHLQEGAPVQNRINDYLTNLRIEEAVYLSAQKRQTVSL